MLDRQQQTNTQVAELAEKQISVNGRPVLFDGNGREIRAESGANTGIVVTRANSGFLLGGTGYAQHGASFRKRALAAWIPWAGSPDTDIVRNLPVLRARSRDLYMSYPFGKAAIETKVKNVVGTGIHCIPLPDYEELDMSEDEGIELGKLILKEWHLWSTELCDWERTRDLTQKLQEIYRTKEMSGDAPVLFAHRNDGKYPYSLKIRTIDPDRLMNPFWIPVPTFEQNVWGGVELKHYNGPLEAYWIAQFHPLDYGLLPQITVQKWTRIPAFTDQYLTRNAILHYNIERPQQRRGVPPLAVCFELAKGMQRFINEKISKEVISNFFSVFIESPMPTEDVLRNAGLEEEEIRQLYKVFPYDIALAPGGVTFMKPGDKVSFAQPELAGTDTKVFTEVMNSICSTAIGVPYEIVMMMFGESYSAARGAFEEFWKAVKLERQLLIDQVLQPIYENFLGELVLEKVVKVKKYFTDYRIRKALSRCLWAGMAQGTIDPLKDIQAAMMRVQLGISTVQKESVAYNGSNWEENVIQLALEKKTFEDSDLTYLAFPGSPQLMKEQLGAQGASLGAGGQPQPGQQPKPGQPPSGQPKPGDQQPRNTQPKAPAK